MISREDCIGLCDLSYEEVIALAEHEHIPVMAAFALAQSLLSQERGCERIRDMILDDISHAVARGDSTRARRLEATLAHFVSDHPEVRAVPPLQSLIDQRVGHPVLRSGLVGGHRLTVRPAAGCRA